MSPSSIQRSPPRRCTSDYGLIRTSGSTGGLPLGKAVHEVAMAEIERLRCNNQKCQSSSSPPPTSAAPASPSRQQHHHHLYRHSHSHDTTDPTFPVTAVASTMATTTPTSSPRRTFQSFPPACYRLLLQLPGNGRCMDCYHRNPQWATVSYGALLCLQCSGHHRSFGVNTSCVRSLTLDEWSLEEVLSMLEGGNEQLTSFFERHRLTEDSLRNPPSPPPTKTQASLPALTTSSSSNSESSHGSTDSLPDNHKNRIITNNVNNAMCRSNSASNTAAVTRNDHSSSMVKTNSNVTIPNNTTICQDNVTKRRYKTKAALFYRQNLEAHVNCIIHSHEPYQGRESLRQNKKPSHDRVLMQQQQQQQQQDNGSKNQCNIISYPTSESRHYPLDQRSKSTVE
jgi:hypothetical protein